MSATHSSHVYIAYFRLMLIGDVSTIVPRSVWYLLMSRAMRCGMSHMSTGGDTRRNRTKHDDAKAWRTEGHGATGEISRSCDGREGRQRRMDERRDEARR